MNRLTTNKDVSEMSMYELAHNSCYSKDGVARYRDFEMDMDARDFARNLMTTLAGDDLSTDDDVFDEEIMENLMYDPFESVTGLIALFYRNLWAMADLRETLKAYEDEKERSCWILCSEQLPEDGTAVLVQDFEEFYEIGICETRNGVKGFACEEWWSSANNYIAWQPLPAPSLPAPYQQKESEKDER